MGGKVKPAVLQLKNDFWRLADAIRADQWRLFWICILADFIGMMSYFPPVIGEIADFAWAPFFAWFLQFMFGSYFITAAGAIEEIMPFTDFIPVATIAWFIANKDSL